MLHANIGSSDPACYSSETEHLPVNREAPRAPLYACTVCGRVWPQPTPPTDGVAATRPPITDEQWLIVAVALALTGIILPAPVSVAVVFLGLGVLIRSLPIHRKQEYRRGSERVARFRRTREGA